MNQEEKQRVIALEAQYEAFQPRLQALQDSLADFQSVYENYQELREFYGSKEWFDLREKPHQDLKAGILSEDQLYDMITSHNGLLSDLLDTVVKMYKHN